MATANDGFKKLLGLLSERDAALVLGGTRLMQRPESVSAQSTHASQQLDTAAPAPGQVEE